jgi:hypothetical protein
MSVSARLFGRTWRGVLAVGILAVCKVNCSEKQAANDNEDEN